MKLVLLWYLIFFSYVFFVICKLVNSISFLTFSINFLLNIKQEIEFVKHRLLCCLRENILRSIQLNNPPKAVEALKHLRKMFFTDPFRRSFTERDYRLLNSRFLRYQLRELIISIIFKNVSLSNQIVLKYEQMFQCYQCDKWNKLQTWIIQVPKFTNSFIKALCVVLLNATFLVLQWSRTINRCHTIIRTSPLCRGTNLYWTSLALHILPGIMARIALVTTKMVAIMNADSLIFVISKISCEYDLDFCVL